jgi:uncharacterized protein Yka (UPF0111/DUF47 family)
MVHIWENVKGRVGVITDLEHQGDAITHQIFEQLHRSMITPFDREDIAQLAHSLDRAADRATNICERVVFTVTGKMEEIGASKY